MKVSLEDLLIFMLEAGIPGETVKFLKPGEPLLKQGLDSMDYPAFVLTLEDRLGITIGEKEAMRLRTLEDYQRYLSQRLKLKP